MAVITKLLDISTYNTPYNWDNIKADVDAIIIRLGYRGYSKGNLTIDSKFKSNIKSANDKDIPLSVYFFSQAINETEAVEEADYVIENIKGYNMTLPIFFDSEYSNEKKNGRADKLSKTQRTNVTIAFCERLKSKGFVPGVYASDSWFKDNLDLSRLTSYPLWVAKYSSKAPQFVKNYIGWQYTSNGTVKGISGRVDLSHWYDVTNVGKDDEEDTPIITESVTIKTGDRVNIKDAALYGTASIRQSSGKKTGIFYIWSDIITNRRVRITNRADNVGKAGCVTGWISIDALDPNKVPETTKGKLKTGDKVALQNVDFYATSAAEKPSAVNKTGVYYIWSANTVNGRIRITNRPDKVGKTGNVTAWINTTDII